MKPLTIDTFRGIAPRFEPGLKPGYARTAENCDLADGKIGPLLAASLQEADANGYNSLYYFNGEWERGDDRYYLQWNILDNEILVYLKGGVPYKKVGATEALLGQTRLGAPTTALNGAGVLTGDFYYIITTTRNVGGYTDESGPSAASAVISASSNKILVTCPALSDADVSHWNLYRLNDATGEYQLVATIAAATTTYDDNTADADLGDAITTWYTSDQGNDIVWDKPQVTFDGLIDEPYSGMIFGWKGPTLYWSEPGYMDAWPGFYNMNFPFNIKRVLALSGVVVVLTEKGPHVVDGSHPEQLSPSKLLGKEPCVGLAACQTSRGVAYLSDSGIVLFNLTGATVITNGAFTEGWFVDNVDPSGAILADNDNQLYLFHSGGVLKADLRTKPVDWTTLDILATGVHVDGDGNLFYMDSTGIRLLHGDTEVLVWTWKSGDIVGRHPNEKPFNEVEIMGSGTITATLYVDDDVAKATKALAWDMIRRRTLKLPSETMGRAIQVELTGTGEVTEMIVRYSE